ncbi:type II secretion system protein GspM [Aliamphritea spongicola]|nr:type II secretion system protein GspM [Aliamphritea spongicola]
MTYDVSRWQDRYQPYLAFISLIIGLGFVYLVIVYPLTDAFRDRSQQIEALRFQLGKYQQIQDSRAAIDAQHESIQQVVAQQQNFLVGDSSAVTEALMLQLIQQQVQSVGSQIRTSQLLSSIKQDESLAGYGIQEISQRVQLTMSIAQLTELLRILETHRPILQIKHLTVNPVRGRSSNGRLLRYC